MTLNVADKETLDAIFNSLKIAKEGTDITVATVTELVRLGYTDYKWSTSTEILEVQVPLEGYYTINATLSAEHSSNTDFTYGANVYVGTDETSDNNSNRKTVSAEVPVGGTAVATGSSMYMRRGEKMVIKAQGWSTGPAYLKDLTVSYAV